MGINIIKASGSGGGGGDYVTLEHDCATVTVVGIIGETTLKDYTIPGGTMGVNDCISWQIGGTKTGAAGNKTLAVYLGATKIHGNFTVSTAGDWQMRGEIFNVADDAIQHNVYWSSGAGSTAADYSASAEDTSGDLILKVTVQLAAADTITADIWRVSHLIV